MINQSKIYRYGGQRTLEALSKFASSPEVYATEATEAMVTRFWCGREVISLSVRMSPRPLVG